MMKKITTGIALLFLAASPLNVCAGDYAGQETREGVDSKISMGAGYAFLTTDGYENIDIDLAAVYASISYKIPSGKYHKYFSLTPEIRIGTGVSDDSGVIEYPGVMRLGYDVELDYLLSFSLRGEINLGYGFYMMVVPSYTMVDISVSGSSRASQGGAVYQVSDSDSSWELGVGAGLGYSFTNSFAAEAMYERVDEVDAYSLAVKYYF